MSPKEKAKELVDRYFNDYGEKMENGKFMLCIVSVGRAKQCALICVDEILEGLAYWKDVRAKLQEEFWQEVKEKINKL